MLCEQRRKLAAHGIIVSNHFLEDGRSLLRLFEFTDVFPGAERIPDSGLDRDGSQFLRTQQRHGGNRNSSRFEYGKPACRQHGSVSIA